MKSIENRGIYGGIAAGAVVLLLATGCSMGKGEQTEADRERAARQAVAARGVCRLVDVKPLPDYSLTGSMKRDHQTAFRVSLKMKLKGEARQPMADYKNSARVGWSPLVSRANLRSQTSGASDLSDADPLWVPPSSEPLRNNGPDSFVIFPSSKDPAGSQIDILAHGEASTVDWPEADSYVHGRATGTQHWAFAEMYCGTITKTEADPNGPGEWSVDTKARRRPDMTSEADYDLSCRRAPDGDTCARE